VHSPLTIEFTCATFTDCASHFVSLNAEPLCVRDLVIVSFAQQAERALMQRRIFGGFKVGSLDIAPALQKALPSAVCAHKPLFTITIAIPSIPMLSAEGIDVTAVVADPLCSPRVRPPIHLCRCAFLSLCLGRPLCRSRCCAGYFRYVSPLGSA
jgi:hypothetical protein